jgi:hypothetical protein
MTSGCLGVKVVPFERLASFHCSGHEARLARMSWVAGSEGGATGSPTNKAINPTAGVSVADGAGWWSRVELKSINLLPPAAGYGWR